MNRRQALTKAIQALASVPVLGWCVGESKETNLLPPLGSPYPVATSGFPVLTINGKVAKQIGPNTYLVRLV